MKKTKYILQLFSKCLFIWIFINFCIFYDYHKLLCSGAPSPKIEQVNEWANSFSQKITYLADEFSGAKEVKKSYEKLNLKVKKVDGHEMVQELSTKLNKFFSEKVGALRRLARKAVELEDVYEDNFDDDSDLFYNNGKTNLTHLNLTFDAHFGVRVNFNQSIVHIPTEVYDRGPAVARDIIWTKGLNKIFQENLKKTPSLSWQYFGTAEGIHRQYPGRLWPLPSGDSPDMYDARRRPWYIQGASSPKDVVLLIDISGSMLGIRIDIAKYASHVLIETLTTNDFFHVVLFNNQSHFICCNSSSHPRLLQATRRNKEFVKGLLPKIDPEDISDWYRGLETSLSLLNETKYRREGSGCQQVIIILSDGSATYERSVFEKYDPNNTIRVFTYVVGLPQYDVEEMKEMAERHKGFYLRIPSLGAVWETVSTFIRVLSRPVGLTKKKPVAYTSVFMDATGTGLVSTVSIPVFKRRDSSKLLGVMATDVPVKDMSEFILIPLIGHNGYVFSIDNNGLILIHPALDGDKLSKLNPQPNMNVDELEFSATNHSHVLFLRKSMIRKEKGSIEFESYIKTIDELRVRRGDMTYHFIRSNETAFSIAVASDQSGFIVTSPTIGLTDGLESLSTVDNVKKWPYCRKIRLQKNVKKSLIKLLTENQDYLTDKKECDHRMLNGLFIDATATASIPEFWASVKNKSRDNGIRHVYVKTHHGVTRRESTGNYTMSKHEIKTENEIDLTAQSIDEYGRVIRQENDKMTISAPLQKQNGAGPKLIDEYVSIYKPVRVGKNKTAVAVTKMEMNYDAFRNLFIKETKTGSALVSCDRSGENQVAGLYCYILDENAFVVASNMDEDSGLFFGEIDPMVMKQLAQSNASNYLYDVVVLPDHQAACKLYPDKNSDATRLMSTLFFLPFATWNIVVDFVIMLWWSLWYSTPSNIFTSAVSRGDEFLIVTCTRNTTLYLAKTINDRILFEGTATCDLSEDCERNFSVSSIKNTNLFFVVVNSECGRCNSMSSNYIIEVPGKNKDHELTSSTYEKVKVLEQDKVRRNPQGCHGPSGEDNSHYGNSRLIEPSIVLLSTSILVIKTILL